MQHLVLCLYWTITIICVLLPPAFLSRSIVFILIRAFRIRFRNCSCSIPYTHMWCCFIFVLHFELAIAGTELKQMECFFFTLFLSMLSLTWLTKMLGPAPSCQAVNDVLIVVPPSRDARAPGEESTSAPAAGLIPDRWPPASARYGRRPPVMSPSFILHLQNVPRKTNLFTCIFLGHFGRRSRLSGHYVVDKL